MNKIDVVCKNHDIPSYNIWRRSKMSKVNLDAMIQREDFTIIEKSNEEASKNSYVKIIELVPGAGWLKKLRKPLFQRVTDEWDSKRISDFISSFIYGDFIPPIIVWKSAGGSNFVIDGSHRLATLIAWTHDDYGDKELSQKFYGLEITQEQRKAAIKTRHLIEKSIGSYTELQNINQTNNQSDPDKLKRAGRLQSAQLEILLVTGTPETAESSFIKINDSAAIINKTERELIETRNEPVTIAARSIIHAGTGHEYWSSFSETKKKALKAKAKIIHDGLFEPQYESPVYDTNLPLAGKPFTGHPIALVRNFVLIVNKKLIETKQEGKRKKVIPTKEEIETLTLTYLQKCEDALALINLKGRGDSLGIHPAFYVYTPDGRLKPASFYAVVAWVLEMKENNLFDKFLMVRKRFEEAIEIYDYIIQQIVRDHRSANKSYPYVKNFYLKLIDELSNEEDTGKAVQKASLAMNIRFSKKKPEENNRPTKRKADRNVKSQVFLDLAKSAVIECGHCGGRLHKNTISMDHTIPQSKGGRGTPDNLKPMHPYCNGIAKNKLLI